MHAVTSVPLFRTQILCLAAFQVAHRSSSRHCSAYQEQAVQLTKGTSDMKLTIYTTGPACIRCTMTKKVLDKKGIDYTEVDIRNNQAAREYITEDLGYSEAPVCIIEDGTDQNHWSGFRPDLIEKL